MKTEISIGVICLARKTFDYNSAKEIYENIKEKLMLIEDVKWHFIDDLIFENSEVKEAITYFKAKELDGIVIINGTFALGTLVLEISKLLRIPILLWGLDELPSIGGRIRLNSLCGLNLNASNLYKTGFRNYVINFGDKINENWLDALRIIKSINSSRIGLLGYHAKSFIDLAVDELWTFKELGCIIEHYEIKDLLETQVQGKKIEMREKQIKGIFNVSELSNEQLNKVASLIAKFEEFMKLNKLDALAIRCWPEFAEYFGIAPCAAMSILQSEGKIIACEGDIMAAITMLALKSIGVQASFLSDLSRISLENNTTMAWHCGVAPHVLWDKKSEILMDTYFANGKGVTAGFILKPGKISLIRLDYSPNELRIFMKIGEAIPTKKDFKGTYVNIKFEEPIWQIFEDILYNGLAHHFVIAYGNYLKTFEILGRIKNWNVLK
ncbi:MAG: fucose isomerase [Promethearchaeota archaeon]